MIGTPANPIVREIDRLTGFCSSQLIDRARVIDGLLDLRLAASGHDELTAAVDEALRTAPGRSLVETAWFTEALAQFSAMAERAVVAAV